MAGKDKATIAKEAQEEASNKQAAAEAAAKEATKLEAAAKVPMGMALGGLELWKSEKKRSRYRWGIRNIICAVKNR